MLLRNHLCLTHDDLGLTNGGDINQFAIKRHRTEPVTFSLGHGIKDALGTADDFFIGREHIIGQGHLFGVDGPFAQEGD